MAVKYDEECKQILNAYCEQENVNKMEAARRGIKKLKDDLKNKRKRRQPWDQHATSPTDR
ncbi:hypothetical protein [Faecalispora anaeroviscerum]|uniref:hypothetical protein n=1 Tax=Faecalispora anaeroviscerum TaxID=2991836 RepID=UPI0024BBAED3|nr:hypothetical protein [Faecalispora anaeroviscerum]